MNLKRIRKALVAGATAGLGAAITYQVSNGWKFDAESVGLTVSAFAAAGIPAAWATWRVPNAPATVVDRTHGFGPR